LSNDVLPLLREIGLHFEVEVGGREELGGKGEPTGLDSSVEGMLFKRVLNWIGTQDGH
jgi:hypothetical protein